MIIYQKYGYIVLGLNANSLYEWITSTLSCSRFIMYNLDLDNLWMNEDACRLSSTCLESVGDSIFIVNLSSWRKL